MSFDPTCLAARIAAVETIPDPWPHAVLDDFFPPEVFAELLESLPRLKWNADGARVKRSEDLPASVFAVLRSETILDAIRARFDFAFCRPMIELVYRRTNLAPHVDRRDKLWSGQIYVAGDEKGTELYDAAGELAHVIDWKPNRLACWTRPPQNEKHAAPHTVGRTVLLYWMLKTKG